MDYSVGKLHEQFDKVLHYHDHDSLLIHGIQKASGTYTWQDSEWSKGSFLLDMMAWDPSIDGFLHDRTLQMSRTIQWYI